MNHGQLMPRREGTQPAELALGHRHQRSYRQPRPYASRAAPGTTAALGWARATRSPQTRPALSKLRTLLANALDPKTLAGHPFLLSVFTAVAFSTYYFPRSTQNAYFLHIIARWGDLPALRTDWLYQTPEPYIFFNYLHFLVGYLGSYELTTLLLFISIASLGFFAIYRLLTACFGVPLWFSAAFLLIFCNPAVSLLLEEYKIAPALFLGGIASQSLFYPAPLYYQPGSIDLLYFVCLWLIAQSRYTAALALSSGIALMHPIMLTSSFFLYCAVTIALWKEATFRQMVVRSILSLAIVLPVLLYHFYLNWGFDGREIAEARHIMLDVRTPHETAVAVWFSSGDALRLALIGFGCMALFLRSGKPTVLRVFLMFVGISVALSAVTFATGSATLRLLEPWRTSTVYLPLLTIFSLWVLGRPIVERLWRFRIVQASVMCGIGLAALSPLVTTWIMWQSTDERRAFYRELGNLSDRATVFAHLPRSFEDIRLGAGVPIFVDFKSPAFTAGDLIEWHRRVGLLEGIDFSQCDDLEALMRKEKINFFIFDRVFDQRQVSQMQQCRPSPALEHDGFVVYRVDGR